MNEVCNDPDMDRITYALVGAVLGMIVGLFVTEIHDKILGYLPLITAGISSVVGWRRGGSATQKTHSV
ncbi:MAG TPA: hypothetical protein PKU78_06165 [Candidatus Dojkabacteria bacterium]|nr:hypothetical protein [Candidatus Dojkabacteria bacterium]